MGYKSNKKNSDKEWNIQTNINNYIPDFNLSDRFCYFLDLAQADDTTPIGQKKRQLAEDVNRGLINPVKNQLDINQSNELPVIKTAIDFLEHAAQGERTKELRVIKQYIKKQTSEYKGVLNENLLKKLEEQSNNLTPENFDQFYVVLTKAINEARDNAANLTRAVSRINDDKIRSSSNSLFQIEKTIQQFINTRKKKDSREKK